MSPLRPRFFLGQLVGADDFNAVIEYFDWRLRQQNRCLHPAGVVHGLAVSIDVADITSVTVAPGCAIDRRGAWIELDTPATIELTETGPSTFVTLALDEEPVMVGIETGEEGQVGFTRVREFVSVNLVSTVTPEQVVLAMIENGVVTPSGT